MSRWFVFIKFFPVSFNDSDTLRTLNNLFSDTLLEHLMALLFVISFDLFNDKYTMKKNFF